ncbi:ATP-binding protein [Streptomyces sp. H27-H5]|uniref:ATP-binding protein n=1 Tax=Streptomyces sp. H27-H5 TaxID=2996460 RepID=UPI002D1E430D|nr:ATP-binding protein [Streptomyces sp. H27-H5]
MRRAGAVRETGGPVAEQTRRLVLGGATTGVVTRCRDFTRQALADWQWTRDQDAVDDVLLLVSEVVTNACLHAGGPRELVLRHAPGRLRVEVSDDNPEPPRRRVSGDRGRPGGHGLVVLERLARSWGAQPSGGAGVGKTVWLEVPGPGTDSAQAPEQGPGPDPGRSTPRP